MALSGVKEGQGEITSEMDGHFALVSCLRMNVLRPAFAHRSISRREKWLAWLRAGGKPASTPDRVRGKLFRHHALIGRSHPRGARLERADAVSQRVFVVSGVIAVLRRARLVGIHRRAGAARFARRLDQHGFDR